jgi:hypothetical protein
MRFEVGTLQQANGANYGVYPFLSRGEKTIYETWAYTEG